MPKICGIAKKSKTYNLGSVFAIFHLKFLMCSVVFPVFRYKPDKAT